MKSNGLFICIVVITILISATSLGFTQETLSIVGTASTGGTTYMVAAAITNFIHEYNKEISIRPQVTGGTPDNILLMQSGEIEFGINVGTISHDAYGGLAGGWWEGKPQKNLRAILRTHASVFHFVLRKGAGIKSIEDLRGTRGCPGGRGSGTLIYTEDILRGAGMSLDDFSSEYTGYSEAASLLKDGHIDWALYGLTVPGSNVMDLAASIDIDLLPIDGVLRENILKKVSYVPYTIPGGTYKGIGEDVETIASTLELDVDESVPEDIVYNITKTIFENIGEVNKLHAALRDLSLNKALEGINIPLHPGAEKYYREVGLIK